MIDAIMLWLFVTLTVLAIVVFLLSQRRQTRAVDAFAAAAAMLASAPSEGLSQLIESGEKLSEGRFAAAVRGAKLFEALRSSLRIIIHSSQAKNLLGAFFKRFGARLVKTEASNAAGLPVAIFIFSQGTGTTMNTACTS